MSKKLLIPSNCFKYLAIFEYLNLNNVHNKTSLSALISIPYLLLILKYLLNVSAQIVVRYFKAEPVIILYVIGIICTDLIKFSNCSCVICLS